MSYTNIDTSAAHNISGNEAMQPAALPLDMASYRAEVDQFDITEEQKQELLLTLWSIMRSFVELGFTADVCGSVFGSSVAIPADQEFE